MSKRIPQPAHESPIAPWQAVAILLAVCLTAWAVILGIVLVTLLVAGSAGLVTVVLWVAAVFAHPTQDGAR